MATAKGRGTDILGFGTIIGIAGLVGLTGGFSIGVWDSIRVIYDHAPRPVALSEIFLLALYSVAVYAVLGCLAMAAIGVVSTGVIRLGKYGTNKSRLGGAFIGVAVLFGACLLLEDIITSDNTSEVVGGTVICTLSAMAIAGLSIYVLGKGIRKDRLIALCISSFVSLLVLLYGGLWVNLTLTSEETFFEFASLWSNAVFLFLLLLLAGSLYILTLLVLRKHGPRGLRWAGYILPVVTVGALITISLLGPFSSQNTPGASVSQGLEEKPNILWIVMDTVRPDHLSCYGHYHSTTPRIDMIASEGTLFEHCISAGSWTFPSHASMFTGMFPSKHGGDEEHYWLDDELQTIAEVLHWNGYKTFGYSNNAAAGHLRYLNQGFATWEETPLGEREVGSELADHLKIEAAKRYLHNRYLEDEGARRTNEVVRGWIADAHEDRTPFFVFINYMEAHAPWDPPESYATRYLSENIDLAQAMRVNQGAYGYVTGRLEMSDDHFDVIRALYDGEISYLDFRMGQLFDYLIELDILDNTVVIITSDHGENFGEHHLMGHFLCVYDTLLHVPLIIRYPESFEAGFRVEEQVQLTDIFKVTVVEVSLGSFYL